ncbi:MULTISPECIES: anti-phage Hailong system effector protein HalA [unclassified Pseudomonas]|uniref:anti-phage Hailong system effector protein HalA n=1 Tax=unclassified Pseudomonas TaxID=196821 RepID=UPI00081BD26D|nr:MULTISPECIES: pentapeptide repeat-containing protein [unclassified Pseudomonas]
MAGFEQDLALAEAAQQPVVSGSEKRGAAYWDSIYTGKNLQILFHGWDLKNNNGPSQLLFTSDALLEFMREKSLRRFNCKGKNFDECDFNGEYISEAPRQEISFGKCTFTRCDFESSVWRGVKFSECRFDKCSFTLSEFQDCTFYQCEWVDITLSGTATKLPNTLISNPYNFINSAYTNLDRKVLSENKKDPDYQKMRLEGTKAKFSRVILKNAENHGDEDAYYDAIKTYLNQSLKSRIHVSVYEIKKKKGYFRQSLNLFAAFFELLILNISGTVNCWGKSIARPAIIGISITLIFGIIYGIMLEDLNRGLIKGFDITFLVGYTKHSERTTPGHMQLLYGLNAFFGLWWYAVLVPTIINRISRVN